MKKIYVILLFCFFPFYGFSQSPNHDAPPQAMSYQAIAYDPDTNLPITNHSVSLKISIHDFWQGGDIVYQEIFFGVLPNAQGVFSLNIGQGVPVGTYEFKNIKWGVNAKFLKVEMDTNSTGNGTDFLEVGINQLMSVPYALYSEKSGSASSIATVKTIEELRNFTSFNRNIDVATVYVQGYSTPSDGGGGTFIFKRYNDMGVLRPSEGEDIKRPVHDGGIFISSYDSYFKNEGIWIRQFNGEIDVRYYGAFGQSEGCECPEKVNHDGIIECTQEKIQRAINYAAKSVGNVNDRPYGYNRTNIVFLPNGSYCVGQLTLKSGVTLKGSSTAHTVIKSFNDKLSPLVKMSRGIVKDVHVSGITFVGHIGDKDFDYGNIKSCFYFLAEGDPDNKDDPETGGLWESSFKDINILRFNGHSIYFEGGTGTAVSGDGAIVYQHVNQFITFEGVNVESAGELRNNEHPSYYNNYHALAIAGVNGQFSFNNCRFDGGKYLFSGGNGDTGDYEVNGRNIYIGPVNVENKEIATPSVINFNTCTIQGGEVGYWIDGAQNITINSCWFENFERGIMVKGTTRPAKSINIMNNLFGRSAGRYGSLSYNSGSVITYENAQVNVLNNNTNNYNIGEEQVRFIALENNGGDPGRNLGVNTFGNTFEENKLRYSWGIKKDIDVSGFSGNINEILTESAKLIYLTNNNGDTKVVSEITSLVSAGEIICIRSNQGQIKFTESDNIYLGNMNNPSNVINGGNLTINNGGFALFVKSDDGTPHRETYNLLSFKNRE